jgi:hypothetical protein
MKTLSSGNATAVADSVLLPRDFLEITVKNRTTGAPYIERLWSDTWDNFSAAVFDPTTGTNPTYTWRGAYGMVDMDPIPRVSSIEVQRIEIRLLAFGSVVDEILRTYDPTLAPVRIWRGWLNKNTRKMSAPAEIRFIGFIDDITIPTIPEGDEGWATITCISMTQEATRFNPDTRSDASQQLRSPGDTFFKDAINVGDWTIYWGKQKAKAT